jgi:C-terminal processing protease CtpA/Prc
MKRILLLAVLGMILVNCSSVKRNNKIASKTFSPDQLKRDVDFTYRKLQKLQPELYWYISKEQLDYKFDSLKTTITSPMTSMEFYKKLSPVVASIRQGHLSLSPVTPMMTKAETAALMKKGIGPFSQFETELIDNKLYVVKNKSYDKSIQPGYEIVSINDQPISDLIRQYYSYFASDGFNQTFKPARLSRSFSNMYSNEYGIKDSIGYMFQYNDSVKFVNIRRSVVDSVKTEPKDKVVKKKKLTKADKDKLMKENRKKSIYGFNNATNQYNRELAFKEVDSSVAVMTIRGFSIGDYYSFYQESFKKIKDKGSNTLVIDLRNNPGGRLREIHTLYSYLADTTFVFTDSPVVRSKTSMFAADYIKTGSTASGVVKAALSPLYYTYTFIKTKKGKDGKYHYRTKESKPAQPKPLAFEGKVYVLINGGSFSASSISSNLKGSGRAYFVGQETGGAYNGTVAGRMPIVSLPNSKVKIRIGLMLIAPAYKTSTDGRGIFPDKEIIPTLADRVSGNDPEMNWVLDDIRKNNHVELSAENQEYQ